MTGASVIDEVLQEVLKVLIWISVIKSKLHGRSNNISLECALRGQIDRTIRIAVPISSQWSRLTLLMVFFAELQQRETSHYIKINKMAVPMQHEKR